LPPTFSKTIASIYIQFKNEQNDCILRVKLHWGPQNDIWVISVGSTLVPVQKFNFGVDMSLYVLDFTNYNLDVSELSGRSTPCELA